MTEAMTELSLFEALALDCRVDEFGTVRYYNSSGQLHRAHGPAVVRSDGHRSWYQNGLRHRPDGPAVEWADVGCAWFQNGLRHRLDGPAVDYADGHREWYINGKDLTESEWLQAVASMGIV